MSLVGMLIEPNRNGAAIVGNDWEKKTGRIELRLPETKKQAFHEACEAQGDQPSSALRRFIDSYIRRASRDEFKQLMSDMGRAVRRNGGAVTAAIVGVVLISGAAIYLGSELLKPRGYPPINHEVFARFDADGDGRLYPGEIRADDSPIQRVLDLDGSGFITPDEFIPEANMMIGVLEKPLEGADLSADKGTGNGITLPVNCRYETLVTFSLVNPALTMIQVSEPVLQERTNPDGSVSRSFSGFDRAVLFNVTSLTNAGPLKPFSQIHRFGFHPRPEVTRRT